MEAKQFVRSVAALRRDGEEEDEQPYEMSIDEAFDTLDRLIREAREILQAGAVSVS